MNAINTYGYAVYRNPRTRMPLHTVAIFSEKLISFAVFDNARSAKDYILTNCGGIAYDPDFDFLADFGDLLQYYLTTDPVKFFKKPDGRIFIQER